VTEQVVEPVRIPKAAAVVAARLRRRIVSGDLEHGGSLPNESQLMRHFEVSRPTVREALRILESESLIAVKRGANGGAKVQRPDVSVTARHAALWLRTQQTPLVDVFEARRVIEPAAAGLLAANRTDDNLQVLRQSHERLLALADDAVAFPSAAAQFHLQVVELAGNRTLALFGRIMLDIVDTHNRAIFDVRPPDGSQVERANREHAELLAHVEARDVDAAAASWERHMSNATRLALDTLGADTTINLAEMPP
jgi:DNA-binding FadR family transcriptional regulator